MAQRVKTDWVLFPTIVLMVCFGLLMVYSATSATAATSATDATLTARTATATAPAAEKDTVSSPWSMLIKQFLWAVASFGVMMYLKKIDYRRFNSAGWAFGPLAAVVILLIGVYFLDPAKHRWLHMPGGGQLQPSEFAKPALILFMAWFISMRASTINTRYTLGPVVTVACLAVAVVMADLGTAVVLLAIALIDLFAAGLKMRYFGFAAIIVLVGGAGAIAQKPYRLGRVIGYVDPQYIQIDKYEWGKKLKARVAESAYGKDPGYHARQAKIAVGAGGVLGAGPLEGKQKLFIPESHTDFIYAVVGEEFGLLGSAAIVIGFVIILWRGLQASAAATDDFGRYLALGVTTMIVFQAFMNISVVLSLFPTKGIPLPMISYGGSSLISSLGSLGLLLSVGEQTR